MGRKSNRPRRTKNRSGNSGGASGKTIVATLKSIDEHLAASAPPGPVIPDKVPMPLKDKQIVTMKRTANGQTITGSTSGISAGGLAIYLASFDINNDLVDTFLFYRIIEITVDFIPVANFVSTTSVDYGQIWTAIDYADDATPSSVDDIADYKTLQVTRTGVAFSRTWTPHFVTLALGAGGDRWAIAPSKQWLWCTGNTSDDVLYYGLKWVQQQLVGLSSGMALYSMKIHIVVQLRHPC